MEEKTAWVRSAGVVSEPGHSSVEDAVHTGTASVVPKKT